MEEVQEEVPLHGILRRIEIRSGSLVDVIHEVPLLLEILLHDYIVRLWIITHHLLLEYRNKKLKCETIMAVCILKLLRNIFSNIKLYYSCFNSFHSFFTLKYVFTCFGRT